jgi:hypothetical protein
MNVRFEGNNGHDADVTRCLLMTYSRLLALSQRAAGANRCQRHQIAGQDGAREKSHARIALSGNDQSDGSPDRYAGKRDAAKIELRDEAFDCFGEKRSVIASLRNVRIAAAWIVQCVHREVFRKLRYHFLEEV